MNDMSVFESGFDPDGQSDEPPWFWTWAKGEKRRIRLLHGMDSLVKVPTHEWVVCPDGSKRTIVCLGEGCFVCRRYGPPLLMWWGLVEVRKAGSGRSQLPPDSADIWIVKADVKFWQQMSALEKEHGSVKALWVDVTRLKTGQAYRVKVANVTRVTPAPVCVFTLEEMADYYRSQAWLENCGF